MARRYPSAQTCNGSGPRTPILARCKDAAHRGRTDGCIRLRADVPQFNACIRRGVHRCAIGADGGQACRWGARSRSNISVPAPSGRSNMGRCGRLPVRIKSLSAKRGNCRRRRSQSFRSGARLIAPTRPGTRTRWRGCIPVFGACPSIISVTRPNWKIRCWSLRQLRTFWSNHDPCRSHSPARL